MKLLTAPPATLVEAYQALLLTTPILAPRETEGKRDERHFTASFAIIAGGRPTAYGPPTPTLPLTLPSPPEAGEGKAEWGNPSPTPSFTIRAAPAL